MVAELSFPRLAARTRSFTLGQPRSVRVSPDGRHVLFLRTRGGTDPVKCLWQLDPSSGAETLVADPHELLHGAEEDLTPEERARRERAREGGGGIIGYALDNAARVVTFALSGRLFRADLLDGGVREIEVPGPVADPQPSPDGRRIAYVTSGALHVTDGDGSDQVIAAEAGVTWGLAEFIAAEEMGRFRGYWWSPDSASILAARVDESPVQRWHIADPANPEQPAMEVAYPRAGTPNADVRLAIFAFAGARVDVEWDTERFPYVVTAHWSDAGPPLISVLTRDQRTMQVLAIDPATGSTSVLHEDTDPDWVEIVPGVPVWGPGGRLVWTVDRDGARRLQVDGEIVTGPELNVRGVIDVTDQGVYLSASADDPAQTLVYLDSWERELTALTDDGINSIALGGPDTTVRIHAGMEHFGTRYTVEHGDARHQIASHAEEPPVVPEVSLLWAGERRLRTGLVLPRGHLPGTLLPVLLDPYGGPHHQEALAARNMWLEPQWFADQGFAVVVADGRGTPGRGTEWERAVAGDLANPPIEDQVDALHAVAADHPDLDLSRVAIRGWSFGGFLAAGALMRRPDVFHAAIAGAPVTDQSLYDTCYTERYLGTDTSAESYRRSSVIDDAANLRGALLIIHGLADDNVVVAHTLRLSAALLAAGKPHTVLPLSGVTHMAQQEIVAENLLLLQVDFLHRALGVAGTP
ncbi:MAG: prolyl oligopeptidase family serine peptidase [Actinomycetota bacterium]|nr:prolyl oligopeptidase family serine peptidase [Actinomycetota bacterium]